MHSYVLTLQYGFMLRLTGIFSLTNTLPAFGRFNTTLYGCNTFPICSILCWNGYLSVRINESSVTPTTSICFTSSMITSYHSTERHACVLSFRTTRFVFLLLSLGQSRNAQFHNVLTNQRSLMGHVILGEGKFTYNIITLNKTISIVFQ